MIRSLIIIAAFFVTTAHAQETDSAASPRYTFSWPLNGAQLQRWIAHASIYAQPSRCEPYGLGIMEAAAAGCALVLGDVACLRELWDGAALFVDPDDADELAHALTGLIDDPLRRANFGVRARLRARRYTSAAMAEGYAALYAELSWRHPQRAAHAQLM